MNESAIYQWLCLTVFDYKTNDLWLIFKLSKKWKEIMKAKMCKQEKNEKQNDSPSIATFEWID